jgi:UDP-glucose:glycoprotein glucosyltransferase
VKDNEPVDSNTPLSEEEVIELGYQASQLIIMASATAAKDNLTTPLSASSSLSPLSAFTILCQNFPKYAQLLSRRVTISPVVDAELRQNALRAQAGANVVWVNGGVVVSPGADVAGAGGATNGVDVLKMKRVLRKEKEWIRALEALGLSRQEAVRVVSDSGGGEDGKPKTGQEISDGRVDASDRPEGGDIVLWWNNIEEDERYSRWSPSFYSVSLFFYALFLLC